MSETMKAIVVKDGEPLHLADVPRPEVGPHDFLADERAPRELEESRLDGFCFSGQQEKVS